MKKKYLPALIAVCVFSAFPGMLNCQCIDADCSAVSQAIQANVPTCHHAATPLGGRGPSGRGCCGKCQIEKAAVLANEPSPASDVRDRNILAEIKSFTDFHSKIKAPSFSREEYPESPPGFFIQRVLNITFSFRAPPQG